AAPAGPGASAAVASSAASGTASGTASGAGSAAAAARDEAARIEPPPALLMLAERLGLTPFERDTLLLAAAAEIDPGIAALYAQLQGGQRGTPTFALALQALPDASWDALSPQRPLRYARLVEPVAGGAAPLVAMPLRADERIVHYLKGLNRLDERLASLLAPAAGGTPPLAPSQRAVADTILAQLQASGARAQVPLVELIGVDGGSKLDVARQVAGALGRHLQRLAIESLPASKTELDALARLWQRERLLLPIALYIDADELAGAGAETVAAFTAFASRDVGLAFVALRDAPARTLPQALAFDVAKPTAREQHDAWRDALADDASAEAAAAAPLLAGHFDLSLRDLGQALTLARAAAPEPPLTLAPLWAACRRLTQPRLDELAQRIEARAGWDDLVLGDEAAALLRQIAAQVRRRFLVYEDWGYAARSARGLGISALFSGESGTGKTMAAEVIARELDLALYRIDLSAVVSKYIGETEKNLRRVFDAAEQGGAILFFDEADALFGKRSEVTESHDRYANIEINYLLQRMEAYTGLAILATNMKSALDAAFMRRLRFVVNFPYPGPAERARMWQRALPEAVPRGSDIDWTRLARFNLSGGNIHAIALNAAFLAAARGAPVTQALLLAAVRTELRKLDRPVQEGEFR
ncbi:MAG: ATP-binding protein, partial [Burkholderiales bacterium]|nr:ATP-binding protein [Burkholderiales bacterium]